MSDDDLFAADDAATPLTPEERRDLIPTYISLRRELNEAEALNVISGERWALSRKHDPLHETFLQRLHLRMFGDVWRWAGKYRQTPRNIGVDHWTIPTVMAGAIDEARAWVDYNSWPVDELAVRFHHGLVAIHPFPNGNGRWSRLAADVLAIRLGAPRFTWGRASLTAASDTRAAYVSALREADRGDVASLVRFARA